jgi:putative ABC transport system permease protein
MFKNYLKITLRNLIRHKVYSVINILALAIGLTCFILILLFIRDELSYDKFHENADRIYRVVAEFNKGGKIDQFACTPSPMTDLLISEYPEVTNGVRFSTRWNNLVSYKNKQFWENKISLVDANIFNIFTFPLVKGDPKSALKNPNSIVVTEEMAKKYFGDENPMGKTLSILNDDETEDYTIAGILKDLPSNSQLQFNFLIPFSHQLGNLGWGCWNYTTYILLTPNYPYTQLEEKFPQLFAKYDELWDNTKLRLQPLTRIHLFSDLRSDLETNRDISHLYIFSGIGLLILFLACVNYMNLTTARFTIREKEVAMRKVVGANQQQLIKQFLGEAILVSFLAFLLALVFVEFSIPIFNRLSGKELVLNYFQSFPFLIALLGLTFFVGILSGGYPAIIISRFLPICIFKKGIAAKTADHSAFIRKWLVIAQFAISIFFISCTLIMHQQLHYLSDKKLGYNKDHLLVLPIFYDEVLPKYKVLKTEILHNPNIINASATAYLPSKPGFRQNCWWEGLPIHETQNYMNWINVDQDFVKTLGLELLAGREFSNGISADEKYAYILNELAVKKIGWQNPIGKTFKIVESGKVIGVVKDFHFQSLHNQIKPVALNIYPPGFKYLLVKISPENIPQTLEFLKQKWHTIFPQRTFEYSFFDDDFNRLYKSETRLGQIFNYIAGLAIFIACMGLFGLTSFATVRRIKEIGIRKVLGATVSRILVLLSKDFVKWVLIGNIIALPIAWYAMNKWLQNFAYRIIISWWMFFLAGALALLIALFTVSWQAVRAATANPVKSLRYE